MYYQYIWLLVHFYIHLYIHTMHACLPACMHRYRSMHKFLLSTLVTVPALEASNLLSQRESLENLMWQWGVGRAASAYHCPNLISCSCLDALEEIQSKLRGDLWKIWMTLWSQKFFFFRLTLWDVVWRVSSRVIAWKNKNYMQFDIVHYNHYCVNCLIFLFEKDNRSDNSYKCNNMFYFDRMILITIKMVQKWYERIHPFKFTA